MMRALERKIFRQHYSVMRPIPVRFNVVAVVAAMLLLAYSPVWGLVDSGPYFPVLSGISWTYRLDDSSTFTTTIRPGTVNVNGVATKAFQDDDGFTNYFTNSASGIRLHGQNDPASGVNIAFVPPIVLANAQTDVGQMVDSKGTAVTNFGNLGYNATYTIAGFQNLSTPMGVFEVARVNGTISIVGTLVTQTFFLGKHMGLVKGTESADGDSFTQEVVARAINVGCPVDMLQSAIDIGVPADMINVTGICAENVLIRNEKQRISINGSGATVNAPSNAIPAVNIRGKGILLQGFTINGGNHGAHVNRGSNAVLNNNMIQNSTGNGVQVDELAFAVLTNNTIQDNPGAGIFVNESSTARIGFNSDSDVAASPNTIQSNALGVIVSNNSSARIIGNTINNNTGDGVQVLRDSHADIASNAINGNAGDGIEVGENSLIQLGEDSGSSIYELPNTTTSTNTGVGIQCTNGGIADGRQGTLTGTSGVMSFDGSCINSLLP